MDKRRAAVMAVTVAAGAGAVACAVYLIRERLKQMREKRLLDEVLDGYDERMCRRAEMAEAHKVCKDDKPDITDLARKVNTSRIAYNELGDAPFCDEDTSSGILPDRVEDDGDGAYEACKDEGEADVKTLNIFDPGDAEELARVVNGAREVDYSAKEAKDSEAKGKQHREVEPLHYDDDGNWQQISEDKYRYDLGFFDKHTATYFAQDEILAGYDDRLDELSDEEVLRRVHTAWNENGDDTVWLMNLDEEEAIEVSVEETLHYDDAYEDWAQQMHDEAEPIVPDIVMGEVDDDY